MTHPTPASAVHLGTDPGLPLAGMPAGPALPDTTVRILLGHTATGTPVMFATSSMELLDSLREAVDAASAMLLPPVRSGS